MQNNTQRWGRWALMALILLGFAPTQASGSFRDLKRSDVAFYAGAGFPIGAFARPTFGAINATNHTLDYHGANIGLTYGLAFDFYVFNEYAGLYVTFQGHANSVREPAASFLGAQGVRVVPQSGWKTAPTQDKWSEFMAMAGGTFRFPLTDWLVGTGRLAIGYAHMLSPFYRSIMENPKTGLIYIHDFSSGSKPAFGYTAGLGLKFLASRGFHIDLRADYMGSTPFNYTNVESRVYVDAPKTPDLHTTSYSFKETFQMVDLSLGFTIAF